MTTLLLHLAAPLQSWGVRSRFAQRTSELMPSRSGIIGMLAAAQGRRRTEPIEDLIALRFGVRMDQPGQMTRDFQTARTLDGKSSMPISDRYYLADAAFLAGIEGDPGLLSDLDTALRHPSFPLYLGRRSCPPAVPVSRGLRDLPLLDALRSEPWLASEVYQRRCRRRGRVPGRLEVHMDAVEARTDVGDGEGAMTDRRVVQDDPVSFDPRHRRYAFREVERLYVDNPGAAALSPEPDPLDPLTALAVDSDPLDPLTALSEVS